MGPLDVAVIVPAYDAQRWLVEALDSVFAQTTAPAEVVVVDDGSRDMTATVAARYVPRVKLVRATHAGAAAARNRGVAESSAPLIAFLDADDLWPSGRLAAMVAVLAHDPSLDAVNGRALCFASPAPGAAGPTLLVPEGEQPGWLPGSFVVRRAAWERVGPFDASLAHGGEFIDWVARAREAGMAIGQCDEVVVRRRIHAQSMSVRARAELDAAYLDVVRAALARRRS